MGTAARRRRHSGLSPRAAVVHAVSLAVAVLVAWYIATGITSHMSFLPGSSVLLGGMWTVCATTFVYREKFTASRTNAWSRVVATAVSFVLTMGYFALFAFTPWGMAVVLGLGALIVDFIGEPGDSVTASIISAGRHGGRRARAGNAGVGTTNTPARRDGGRRRHRSRHRPGHPLSTRSILPTGPGPPATVDEATG